MRRALLAALAIGSIFSLAADAQNIGGHYWGVYDDGKISGDASIVIDGGGISVDMKEEMYTGKPVHVDFPYRLTRVRPFEFLETSDAKWLVLYWPGGIFLSSTEGHAFFLSRKQDSRTVPIDSTWIIRASSFLTEGTTKYKAGNMMTPVGLPWASGNGQGIGDRITIELGNWLLPMLLLNGYVDPARPQLYQANSRLKKARITEARTGRSKTVELKDEPTFQRVDLDDLLGSGSKDGQLYLDVLAVYPGSKYKDLCIKSIIPDFSKVP